MANCGSLAVRPAAFGLDCFGQVILAGGTLTGTAVGADLKQVGLKGSCGLLPVRAAALAERGFGNAFGSALTSLGSGVADIEFDTTTGFTTPGDGCAGAVSIGSVFATLRL